jgi:hypothetical protein
MRGKIFGWIGPVAMGILAAVWGCGKEKEAEPDAPATTQTVAASPAKAVEPAGEINSGTELFSGFDLGWILEGNPIGKALIKRVDLTDIPERLVYACTLGDNTVNLAAAVYPSLQKASAEFRMEIGFVNAGMVEDKSVGDEAANCYGYGRFSFRRGNVCFGIWLNDNSKEKAKELAVFLDAALKTKVPNAATLQAPKINLVYPKKVIIGQWVVLEVEDLDAKPVSVSTETNSPSIFFRKLQVQAKAGKNEYTIRVVTRMHVVADLSIEFEGIPEGQMGGGARYVKHMVIVNNQTKEIDGIKYFLVAFEHGEIAESRTSNSMGAVILVNGKDINKICRIPSKNEELRGERPYGLGLLWLVLPNNEIEILGEVIQLPGYRNDGRNIRQKLLDAGAIPFCSRVQDIPFVTATTWDDVRKAMAASANRSVR